MKRISVELVPRSEEELREELKLLKEAHWKVDRINIPDLLRYELRSWEGAAIAQEYFPAMPHIRAMDVDLAKPLSMGPYIKKHEIHEVLVIEGDPPQDMTVSMGGCMIGKFGSFNHGKQAEYLDRIPNDLN